MKMKHRSRVICFVTCLVFPGCATVDPSAEIDRARQLISQTTGVDDPYHPDQPDLTAEDIESILADGLTLAEAVRLALRNNQRLQAEFMRIGVAKADWVQSGLLRNPTLGLSLLFPEGGGRSFFAASAAQNLVDLWQIPIRKRLAQHELDATVLSIARRAGELAAATKNHYYEAVAADESLKVARTNHDLVTKSREGVRAQRQAGTATAFDESLARGQVLAAELAVRQTRLAAANAKRRLARRLSIDGNVDTLTLTGPLAQEIKTGLSPDRLIQLARASRLDLRAAETVLQAHDVKVALERRKGIDELTVGPAMERAQRRAGEDVIDVIGGPILSLEIPIFDQNQAQIARAEYLYREALKSYASVYRAVAQDIRIAVDRAKTAADSLAFYRDKLIPQAEQNHQFASASFAAGQTNVLGLLESQRSLLEAQRGFITIQREAAAAIADLERTVGIPIDKIHGHRDDTSK